MLTVGSLFSGVGLLDYGLSLAGLEHDWFCERDDFRAEILERRWPGRTVYRDVRAVDARARRVDVLAGGFPCKGFSEAGRREGFGHPETALWREMGRVVRELRPRYVVVENVAALLRFHHGECFGEVLGTLAALGYDAEWSCLRASDFGAPHRRLRVLVLAADASAVGRPALVVRDGLDGTGRRYEPTRDGGTATADADAPGRLGQSAGDGAAGLVDLEPGDDAVRRGVAVEWGDYEPAVRRWEDVLGRAAPEPLVRRVDDGRAVRMERSRLSALGDGVLVQIGRLMGERILDLERAVALRSRASERPEARVVRLGNAVERKEDYAEGDRASG